MADTSTLSSGVSSELEIMAGRRAFATAQRLLAGGPVAPAVAMSVGWHDSSVTETGSFAVVQASAGLDDLVGEVVRVSYGPRSVYAYVLDVAAVPTLLSVTRRLFLALSRLSAEQIAGQVGVVG